MQDVYCSLSMCIQILSHKFRPPPPPPLSSPPQLSIISIQSSKVLASFRASPVLPSVCVHNNNTSGRVAAKNGECLGSFITWMTWTGREVHVGANCKNNTLGHLFKCSTAVLDSKCRNYSSQKNGAGGDKNPAVTAYVHSIQVYLIYTVYVHSIYTQ